MAVHYNGVNMTDSPEYASSGVQAPEVPYAYQSLIDANPYRNAQYKVSPWQKLLSWLGFRTQADAWKENMAVQASEYDSAILQKQFNEDYNDPQSQVARMRAAGLNPDIDPSSISSGEASPMPEDPSTPMLSTGQEGQLMDFAEGIMNIASTALGLVSSVQGISRNALQNSLLATQGETAIQDLAQRMSLYFLPSSDSGFYDEDGNITSSWQSDALTRAKIFSRSMDKRSQGRFLDSIQSYWNGALGESKSYEEFKHNLESRFSYKSTERTLEDEFGSLNLIFAEELGELNKKVMKLSAEAQKEALEAQKAESGYEESYYSGLEGATQSGAENAQARFNQTNMEMNNILNESIGRMIDKLESSRKEGGIGGGLSSIALALLASFRLMITTQGLPSVSRSASSGGSNWSPLGGSASHTSSSFGIGW